MSTPSPVLVSGIGTLTTITSALPSGCAPQASNSVVVTDSGGFVNAPVILTGAEDPPWSWAASYAPGLASAVVTPLDTTGAVIGTPASYSFPVAEATPTTFEAPAGIAFVAATTSAATAAIHKGLK